MPSTSLLRRARSARLALCATAVAAAAAGTAPAALAAPAQVTGGDVDWSQVNAYEMGGAARTWLGYVTTLAQGTAAATAPATGAEVTPSSPKGAEAVYTFAFPVEGGSYDRAARTGTIRAKGTVTFTSALHRFAITVTDPVVTLSGATGTLAASGQGGASGQTPYSADQPLFTLDLSNATVTTVGPGTQRITGIAPALATANTAFPANYQVGAGPDRTPNTFGTFEVTVSTAIDGSIRTQRKRRAVVVSPELRLLKARGARVSLSTASSRARIARGTISGRRLTLTLKKGRTLKPGTYRIWGATNPPLTIEISR